MNTRIQKLISRQTILSLLFAIPLLLTSCGFHLQGELPLAPPLKQLYLETSDPYGQLTKNLQQYLKMSNVILTSSRLDAKTILIIISDTTSQLFLSVNSTQQTRQYNLVVTVVFEITDQNGNVILGPQTLAESKPITIQSNQILGSSNETTLYYQQMRRTLAYAIMNRIASKEVREMINKHFSNRL